MQASFVASAILLVKRLKILLSKAVASKYIVMLYQLLVLCTAEKNVLK
jgi:hypothetical protein